MPYDVIVAHDELCFDCGLLFLKFEDRFESSKRGLRVGAVVRGRISARLRRPQELGNQEDAGRPDALHVQLPRLEVANLVIAVTFTQA